MEEVGIFQKFIQEGASSITGWENLNERIKPKLVLIMATDLGQEPDSEQIQNVIGKGESKFRKETWSGENLKTLFSNEQREILKSEAQFEQLSQNEGFGNLALRCKQQILNYLNTCEMFWYEEYLKSTTGEEVVKFLGMDNKRIEAACQHIKEFNRIRVKHTTIQDDNEYEELYQSVIMDVLKVVKNNTLKEKKNIHSYYRVACTNQYYTAYAKKLIRKKAEERHNSTEGAQNITEFDAILELMLKEEESERNRILLQKLKEAGKNCLEILISKAYGEKADKLAEGLNMTPDSINSTATQCREKLRTLLLEPFGDTCKAILAIYELHKRSKRDAKEEEAILQKIAEKLKEPDLSKAKEQVNQCLDKFRAFFFPNDVR